MLLTAQPTRPTQRSLPTSTPTHPHARTTHNATHEKRGQRQPFKGATIGHVEGEHDDLGSPVIARRDRPVALDHLSRKFTRERGAKPTHTEIAPVPLCVTRM